MRKNNDPQQPFNGPGGPEGPPPPGYRNVPPSDTPKKPKKKRRWVLPTVIGVGAFIMGAAIGGSTGDDADPQMEDSEVRESQSAQDAQEPTEVETETVEVEVTPEDCVVALTHADNAIDIYSQALTLASDGIFAYAEGDYDTLEQSTAEIEAMTGELTTTLTDYYINSDECRGNQQ